MAGPGELLDGDGPPGELGGAQPKYVTATSIAQTHSSNLLSILLLLRKSGCKKSEPIHFVDLAITYVEAPAIRGELSPPRSGRVSHTVLRPFGQCAANKDAMGTLGASSATSTLFRWWWRDLDPLIVVRRLGTATSLATAGTGAWLSALVATCLGIARFDRQSMLPASFRATWRPSQDD